MTDVAKNDLRTRALTARQAGGDQAALTAHLAAALAPHRGKVLSGYWPMRGEPDPLPAMHTHDGPLCLPVVPGKAVPLIFRRWQGEPLVPGPFGTMHPDESQPQVRPQVLIVPLAGFDRAGHRIGYGGGYYDRTLQQLRGSGLVMAIGLAFAVQELPPIPAGPFDQPLDLIVTDRGLIQPAQDHPEL